MNDLEKALRDNGATNWKAILGREGYLIPLLLMYQRTMRLALVIPTWAAWEDSEAWFEIKGQLDSTDVKKFKAWWEMIRAVQRHDDDKAAVSLALSFVVQEQCLRGYGRKRQVNAGHYGFSDLADVAKVFDEVMRNIENLMPRDVAPGADLAGMTRLKFDNRNGKKKR